MTGIAWNGLAEERKKATRSASQIRMVQAQYQQQYMQYQQMMQQYGQYGQQAGYGYGYPYSGYYPPPYYGGGYYGSGYYGGGYHGNGYYGGGSYGPVYASYAYGSGSRSQSSVVRLQQRLARTGYYRGPIDGIMGSRTQYALRAYQHDHGAGANRMTDQ